MPPSNCHRRGAYRLAAPAGDTSFSPSFADFAVLLLFLQDPLASYDVNEHDSDPQPRYDYTNENRFATVMPSSHHRPT